MGLTENWIQFHVKPARREKNDKTNEPGQEEQNQQKQKQLQSTMSWLKN